MLEAGHIYEGLINPHSHLKWKQKGCAADGA